MNERSLQEIKKHLEREEAQERVRRNMRRGREEARVTIGRAARLFNFTENKLRDWETLGLLKPLRSKDITGQRQYSPEELDKLAIIKELIEEGGYAPGSIPTDIDRVWEAVVSEQRKELMIDSEEEAEHKFIEQRVEEAYEELFWRYYASHVLRLSLMLICEEIPSTRAGLVLPLGTGNSASIGHPEDLPKVSEALIGWLGQTRSFYTFLDHAPSFEYPSDYRILPLQMTEEVPRDSTLIVVDRRARVTNLSNAIVETIRRLLAPLYEDLQKWWPSFGQGMRDLIDPANNLDSGVSSTDALLTGLANIVVRLGGQTDDGQDRWRFCCILLPKDPQLPLQQRRLVVQAQSTNAPHKVGETTIRPSKYANSLSLRAFQGGGIIYRRETSSADSTIAFRELEGPIRSAVAVPIGGEKGQPVAVLYIASDELGAFSKKDQRVLRMIGRLIEEVILAYHAREQVALGLSDIIKNPEVVDPLFGDFPSENDFICDVENLLNGIKIRMDERAERPRNYSEQAIDQDGAQTITDQLLEEFVSFMSVDVDNQSALANQYSEGMTRNLSRTIGLRIQGMIQSLITKHTDCKLYHIYGDRYYLILQGIPLEQTRTKAEAMRQALEGSIAIEQLLPSARKLVLPDVTIRLGVTSYTYKKLEENLVSDNPGSIVAEVRAKIARALDEALNMGMDEGGNVVITWDRERGFARWSSKRAE